MQRLLIGLTVLCWSVPASAQIADHLQCFSVKDTTNPIVSSYLLSLAASKEPQLPFEPTPDCRIKSRPDLFCLHVEKTAVDGVPPSGPQSPTDAPSFACYRVKGKCLPAQSSFNLNETDQFRSGFLKIGSTRYVCAPATIGACGQTAIACNGSCPANQVCSSVFFGTCQCVTAAPPACNLGLDPQTCGTGACPANFVCLAAFGGCSCLETCAASFPQCDAEAECGFNSHCGNVGGACACIPNDTDCGGLQQPQCGGGTCPASTTCQPSGPTSCQCM